MELVASQIEATWLPKWSRMAAEGSNMVSKTMLEKGMKKRLKKFNDPFRGTLGRVACGPLKGIPEDRKTGDRLSSLETLHWSPRRLGHGE